MSVSSPRCRFKSSDGHPCICTFSLPQISRSICTVSHETSSQRKPGGSYLLRRIYLHWVLLSTQPSVAILLYGVPKKRIPALLSIHSDQVEVLTSVPQAAEEVFTGRRRGRRRGNWCSFSTSLLTDTPPFRTQVLVSLQCRCVECEIAASSFIKKQKLKKKNERKEKKALSTYSWG